MVDKRRRPFVAIDQLYPFKKTCERLEDEFGHAGPLAFLYLLMAAKRAPVQGELTVTSEPDFWATLGFRTPPDFTMDAFLTLLGRLKQTSRTSRKTTEKRLQNIVLTHFEEWQKLPNTEFARARSSRKRRTNTRDNTRDDTRTMKEPNANGNSTERRGEEKLLASPLPVDEKKRSSEPPPQQAAAARPHTRNLIQRITLEAQELANTHQPIDVANILHQRHPTLTDQQIVHITNTAFT